MDDTLSWHDAISESFPPPDDREPRSLRADILDELADHLDCAARRELLRTRDEAAAQRAALEKFGDPRALAKRLWRDAMKERIMKDRLFLVFFMVGLVALLAAVVMPWAAQQQKMNEAMLQRLQELSTASSRPATLENWTKLNIQIQDPSGAARPAANVSLSGYPFQDAKEQALNETSDKEGRVSYGPIRPGSYQIQIRDMSMSIANTQWITLYAGQEKQLNYTMPVPQIVSDVSVGVELPDSLRETSCVARCEVSVEPITTGSTLWGVTWGPKWAVDMQGVIRDPAPTISGSTWCNLKEGKAIEGFRLPAGRYNVRWTGFFCHTPAAIFVNGPPPEKCYERLVDWLNDNSHVDTFEVKPGKSVWKLRIPQEFVAAYQKQLTKPMQVRLQWPKDLHNSGKAGSSIIGIQLGRVLPVSSQSSELGRSANDIILTANNTGSGVLNPAFTKLDDSRQRPWIARFADDVSNSSFRAAIEGENLLQPGKYKVTRIAALWTPHLKPSPPRPPGVAPPWIKSSIWKECASIEVGSGWEGLTFEVKPNEAATWEMKLPDRVVQAFNECVDVESTTRPE